MKILNFLASILYPNRCIFCGAKCPANDYKCENCEKPERSFLRVFNLGPGVKGKKPHLLRVYSPCTYTGYYRKSLHYFKFEERTAFAESYAKLIIDMDIVNKEADFITFVPMTKKRVRDRGYNQSQLIANKISKKSGIPVKDVLNKVKDSQRQRTLNVEERKRNVKNAFTVKENVKDKNIILVDDIVTTGATLCECALMLYKAGALNVHCICAADVQTIEKTENLLKSK